MVFTKTTGDTDKGAPPTKDALKAMDRCTEELVQAGVLVAAAGLTPMAESRRIAIEGGT